MATGPLNSLVRQIRRAAIGHSDGESDGELLKRFMAHRDEDALASLVRRYAPLVFGVCQRVLHHRQDAEDAFQATFLVLLHKAGSITQPEVLGNWLYGVAYYTAKNARRMAARRRVRERQGTVMAKTQPAADEEVSRELRSILDEEVSRLPEKYRVPVVLCELQGKSRKEAASQLGCPEGTVSSRLSRGREILRRRLTKRGLALPAGSLAIFLARDAASASVPPLLVAGTIKTALLLATAPAPATGVVSAQVAALTEGVLKTMLLAKLKIVTGLVLTISIVTGAGLLAHNALAGKPAASQAAARPSTGQPVLPVLQERLAQADPREFVTVKGRVLGPDGVPLAGARLYLPHRLKQPPRSQNDTAMIQRGTTGQGGRFTLKLPRSDAQPGHPVALIAAADGFGIDWVDLPVHDMPADVTLKLVKDMPIRGRILNTEGKPIAGIHVEVVAIMVPGKLDVFLKALQREWRAAETMMTKQLTLPVTKVLHVTALDKDGRFEVKGAGAGRLVALDLKGPAIAEGQIGIVTQQGLDIKGINQAMANGRSWTTRLYGPTFDHIAEVGQLGRPIEGTVREAGTGKPVAGVTIQATGNVGASAVLTDARGHYRIQGLRRAPQYTLYVTPPTNTPLIGRWVRLSDAPNFLDPIHADIELPRGRIVTGRVVDKTTGKGVQSSVGYLALPDNEFAKKGSNLSLNASTDPDGRYRLVTIPGPGVLVAQVHGTRETINGVRLHPYPIIRYKVAELDAQTRERVKLNDIGLEFANACKVLDLKEGGDTVSCDLLVDPGKTLTVNVEDPDGKSLAGAIASGVTAMPLGAISLKDSACTVYALDPKKPRQVILLHQERGLAAVVTLRGDEKEPLSVRLGPTGILTGRLLDQDRQPIRGAYVAALYAGRVGSDLARELRRRFEMPRADDQGRFRLTGIVPGLKFDLGFVKGRQKLKPETRLEIKPLQARQTMDLGDLRMKPEH